MKKEFSIIDLWKCGVMFDYGPEIIELPLENDKQNIINVEELKKTIDNYRRINNGK